MIAKIEQQTYAYQGGDGVCTVAAQLNIYGQDGSLVAGRGLSASYNLFEDDFHAEIARQLEQQITEYVSQLQRLDARRMELFPDSTDFQSAVGLIFDPLQAALTTAFGG